MPRSVAWRGVAWRVGAVAMWVAVGVKASRAGADGWVRMSGGVWEVGWSVAAWLGCAWGGGRRAQLYADRDIYVRGLEEGDQTSLSIWSVRAGGRATWTRKTARRGGRVNPIHAMNARGKRNMVVPGFVPAKLCVVVTRAEVRH